jgi:ubiquinone/menaquinone biosynthesis C-methylase UbiE
MSRSVDYERIAATYDALPIRNVVPPDDVLGARIRDAGGARHAVLDIGCGTGTWLAAQHAAFDRDGVEWIGADPSEAMLARARSKLPCARFVVAKAEQLPFDDGAFDFVSTRFAYHHFVDKPRAFDEIARVTAAGSALFVMNVAPEAMPGWWVFRSFPEARRENERYWRPERIADAFRARGFEVDMDVKVTRGTIDVRDALAQARVRDQSHLVTLDDDAWRRGVASLERLLAVDPNAAIETESAVLVLRGVKAFPSAPA